MFKAAIKRSILEIGEIDKFLMSEVLTLPRPARAQMVELNAHCASLQKAHSLIQALRILPKKTSTSPVYGYLYEAPYLLNDTMSHTEGTASITLEILQKFGSSYNLKIGYHRQ